MSEQRKRKRFTYEWRRIEDTPYAIAAEGFVTFGDDEGLPFAVTIDIENSSGSPECTRLVVERLPGGQAVTSDGLRKIPVARLVGQVARSLMGVLNDPERGIDGGVTPIDRVDRPFSKDRVLDLIDVQHSDAKRGRRRITEDDLRWIAEICRRADAEGVSYVALAALDRNGITPDQARQWKRKAVAAGFYTPAKAARR